MTSADPLPPCVESRVAAYLDGIANTRRPALRGLYLVGSLALDDFRPGFSDIDFIALVDNAADARVCDALARVHAQIPEGGPHLDGVYVTRAMLRRRPEAYAVVPLSQEGRFRTGEPCREVNPVVWRCLARSGRTVVGAPPADLGIADDEALFRTYQIANLRGYWASWIAQCEAALCTKAPGDDCNAEALAWGVLGVGRIACCLATGRAVSKGAGGRHALAAHPVRWHAVIREALSAHAGIVSRVTIDSVRDGLAYMRFIIDRTGREAGAPP